jgi:hypothetical protein
MKEGKSIGIPPIVNVLSDSNMVIVFTKEQKNAIKDFLKLNPNLYLVTSKYVDPYVKIDNYNRFKKGEMQYQYACWGDLNNDGYLDVVVVFKSKACVNAWGWSTFCFVVLEGQKNGIFYPMKVYAFDGGCLDGILFHKKENVVEYFCSDVAAGIFKWSNGRFIVKKMVGD